MADDVLPTVTFDGTKPVWDFKGSTFLDCFVANNGDVSVRRQLTAPPPGTTSLNWRCCVVANDTPALDALAPELASADRQSILDYWAALPANQGT